MNYELDDIDRDLLKKCRKAIEYDDAGDPVKDVIDQDELVDAVRLLLSIVDAEGAEPQEKP
jgi:hypothetical protein